MTTSVEYNTIDTIYNNDIKEFIDRASKTVGFFKQLTIDEITKNAKLTGKNKKLHEENTYLRNEIENLDKELEVQSLKINSLTINNDEINDSINSFGITNDEFDNLVQMRDELYNKVLQEELEGGGNNEFKQFVEMRNKKREQRMKMYNK